MPNQFAGVEDFMAALTGGDAIEQTAYNQSTSRLIRAASQQALLDKRLQDAAKAEIITNAFRGLAENEPPGRDTNILIAGRGSDFSALQKGVNQEQKNRANAAAIAALSAAAESGEPLPMEYFNAALAIDQGVPLTHTQVKPVEQAQAAINQKQSAADYSDARTDLTRERIRIEALEALTEPADKKTPAGEKAAKPRQFTDSRVAMLFPPDENGRWTAYEKFQQWQTEQELIDPRYADDEFAYLKYKKGEPAAVPAPPPDTTTAAVDALSGQEAPAEEPASPPNMADADMIMQAANDAIAAGKDPDAVWAIAKAELEKMGLTLGQ
jgi:hypothetical protein